ncbi:MAG: PAS domain-containing protein [Verrucomicrobiota bacterium]
MNESDHCPDDKRNGNTGPVGGLASPAPSRDAELPTTRLLQVYETALSNTVDFVYVFDLQGRFTFVNAALLDLWQKSLPEAVGLNFYELGYPPDLAGRLQDQIDEVIAKGQQVRDETPYTSAFGTRHYEYIFTPVFDSSGVIEAVAGSTRDITARKQAETSSELLVRELDAEKNRLSEVFQRAPSFMCVLYGPEHIFERANDRYYEIVGKRDLIGKPVREAVPEVEGQGFYELLDEVYRTGEPYSGRGISILLQRTPGSPPEERFLDFVYQPLRDAEGTITGIMAQGIDLTERMRAESDLKASEERYRLLADELSEADRRKDEFLALLAHELRNPLAPILTGLDIIRQAAGDSPMILTTRAIMERQVTHMVRLIDDLLDISRLSTGKMELRLARVNLKEVVDAAVETASPIIDSAAHQLTISIPAEPIYLTVDSTRLAQVISNLLINSAKYTPPGGHISLRIEWVGDEIAISVQDSGMGIPAESLSSIFGMFSQIDQSIGRRSSGLGIGLALVKGLVELHGARIDVASPGENAGSTFTVRLPVTARESAPPSPEAGSDRPPPTKLRVMVVDDSRDAALSLATLLEIQGNDVRTAHDGLEAVEVAGQFRPDVIFMDVGMPGLSGYEATRRIRACGWGKTIRIIALTGWGKESDRDESKAAGCDGHLVKPIGLEALKEILHSEHSISDAQNRTSKK